MRLSSFVEGLGWMGPVLIIVVLLTCALAIKWIVDWTGARRRMRDIRDDLNKLLQSWRTEALPVAVRTTTKMGYRILLRHSRCTTTDLLDRVLPGLLPSFPETRWTRQGLDLIADVTPLVGLLGTVLGFWLAFNNLADAASASAGFSALAGPSGLALKSTLICLACCIVALVVMGLFSLEGSEHCIRDTCAELHREIRRQSDENRGMRATP